MLEALSRLAVRTASWLVPRGEREAWRLEWSSELWHHRRDLSSAQGLDWRTEMKLFRGSLGAFADALDLRGSASLREGLGADLRYGFRVVRKSPGFTAVAVLLLGLGIGATTAIASVVHGVLLEPLPFRDPERLVLVWEHAYRRGRDRNVASPHNFLRWRERARSFDGLSAFTPWAANLSAEGEAERVAIGYVSPNFFDTLGVSAARGRVFARDDGIPGNERVVVLGDGLWKRRFGAAPDVVGKTVKLDGEDASIVGVLPPGIELPTSRSGGGGVQLWAPFAFTDEHRELSGRYLMVLGRLAPEVTVEQADAEMEQIASNLEREKPDFDAGWSADVYPLQPELVRGVSSAILVLFAAVILVLVIACANVGTLLLSRTLARQRELSVRAALGAHRLRILRQLFVESSIIAALGALAGLFFGQLFLRGLLAMLPAEVPAFVTIELDASVLGFTLSVALLTSLVFGALPALQVSRRDLVQPLSESGRAGTGVARQRLRNALVVVEVALAVVLLVATGLLVRSFVALATTDPGFQPRSLTAVQIDLAGPRYEEKAAQVAFFREAIERLEALPAVERAAAISWLPLGGQGAATSYRVADKPDPPPEEPRVADVRMVQGDLFRTMGIPLLSGRSFDERDRADSGSVVLVNETLANEVWPGEDPIGKTVLMSWGEELRAEVVGVVGDVRLTELETVPRATLYWPQSQLPNDFMTVVVRAKEGTTLGASELRAAVAAIDPEIPLSSIEPMEAVVSRSLGQPRLTLSLMSVFGAVGLLLAAVGLYGVVGFNVHQRAHELGLRMALGASAADVARLVLVQALKLVLVGVVLGTVGAMAASRLLESLLYEVKARDPWTLGLIAALLVVVALAAAYPEARRATRIDPVLALRND